MNRRTTEQGTAEYRSEKHYLMLSNTSAVRNSLFDIRYSKHNRSLIPLHAVLKALHKITSNKVIEHCPRMLDIGLALRTRFYALTKTYLEPTCPLLTLPLTSGCD
jgi:hypothetical protein